MATLSSNYCHQANNSKTIPKVLNVLLYFQQSIINENLNFSKVDVKLDNSSELIHKNKDAKTDFKICSDSSNLNNLIIFKSIKQKLLTLLGFNRYTIYPITFDELSNNPWQDTTAILIVIEDRFYQDEENHLMSLNKSVSEFIKNGGKVISFNYNDFSQSNSEMILNLIKTKMIQKFGEKFLLRTESKNLISKVTEAYLISSEPNCPINSNIVNKLNNDQNFSFRLMSLQQFRGQNLANNSSKIPVIIGSDQNVIDANLFNFNEYFTHLISKNFGRTVIFSDIITSTMFVIKAFSFIDGVIAIANQQTQGQGRSYNEWLSPKGCAMFSGHFKFLLKSKLGQNLGLIQHLISLAIVKSVLSKPGYQQLNLKLKWPNDIYIINSNNDKIKIGGILVQSQIVDNKVEIFFGCGINVNNSFPTTSLNNLIHSSNLEPISIEELIAETLNKLDYLLTLVEKEGPEPIKQFYIEHWIHSKQIVKMANKKQVLIKGLDNHGYLIVEDIQNGVEMSVQPDGNRFDMLHNLLLIK